MGWKALIPCALLLFAPACGVLDTKLTDAMMEKYLQAYAGLKAEGLASGNGQVNPDAAGKFDGIVKASGFKDLAEYMKVQTKVGQAMSIVESDSYIEDMDSMSGIDDPKWAEFKKMLSDPSIPEASKQQIREAFTKAKAEFEKNKKAAMPVLNAVKGVTDSQSVAVVKKYHERLRKLYTGQ